MYAITHVQANIYTHNKHTPMQYAPRMIGNIQKKPIHDVYNAVLKRKVNQILYDPARHLNDTV